MALDKHIFFLCMVKTAGNNVLQAKKNKTIAEEYELIINPIFPDKS